MSEHRPSRMDVCTPVEGKDGKTRWTRVGVAFPSKTGPGWNLILDAAPLNGKLSMFEPRAKDGSAPSTAAPRNAGNPDAEDCEDTPF